MSLRVLSGRSLRHKPKYWLAGTGAELGTSKQTSGSVRQRGDQARAPEISHICRKLCVPTVVPLKTTLTPILTGQGKINLCTLLAKTLQSIKRQSTNLDRSSGICPSLT